MTRTRFAIARLVAGALMAMITVAGCDRSQPGPKPISGQQTQPAAGRIGSPPLASAANDRS